MPKMKIGKQECVGHQHQDRSGLRRHIRYAKRRTHRANRRAGKLYLDEAPKRNCYSKYFL